LTEFNLAFDAGKYF